MCFAKKFACFNCFKIQKSHLALCVYNIAMMLNEKKIKIMILIFTSKIYRCDLQAFITHVFVVIMSLTFFCKTRKYHRSHIWYT